jgi:phospholipid transport system substrate-binding protein
MFKLLLALVALTATSATAVATAQIVDDKGPNELIESVAQTLLNELDGHREELKREPQKIRALVDEYLLPYFDTEYAARLVLARHWRDATPEQRKRFVDAFYQSMLQNYGEALLEFTPDRLTILPFRGDPDDKRATVRTEVVRDNGTRVPVNYTLRRTPEGWKAWDVTIEGISYIKSFRTDFGSEIDQKGLEAVIERLESQASSGAPSGEAADSAKSS